MKTGGNAMTDISRRNLIELGVAGASALAVPAFAQPAYPEKLGFAVVGIGLLSRGQIIPGLRNCKSARLTALVSGHADKAHEWAAKEGVPADAIYNYEDFDRIAHDPRIHVVYIVLPNFMHAEYTIRALKAGKHVLCEKPMATSISDAEAMIAAAKAANRKLMIAYRCHYEPINLEAMRQMRSGAMGKPRIVVTDMGRQANVDKPWDAWRVKAKESGYGCLGDMGVYGVSAMRYLLNEEPVSVRAWDHTDPTDPRFRDTPGTIAWQFRFPSGAIGNGSTSFSAASSMAWRTFSEKGKMIAEPGCLYDHNHLVVDGPQPLDVQPQLANSAQFTREMDWMADVVRGRAPMVSPGEEGVQDMRLMKAIMESVGKDGAAVATDWGYRRAVDPAAVVDVPRSA
jgi:glucose-fructose oxidoreductase